MPFVRGITLVTERVGDSERFPFSLPAVRTLDRLRFDAPVTFLVGENGSGKSTVMEALAIALELNPEGGTQNLSFTTRDSHTALHDAVRPVRTGARPRTRFFLRAESFYNVASRLDELEDEQPGLLSSWGGQSLHDQSHGESFLATVLHRFEPSGLYLLDEPEAALSPQGILTLMRVMHNLVAGGAQFIAATHSPMLLGFPEARIYEIGPDGFQDTIYEDTEHYRLTKAFLENPQAFLRHLFSGGRREALGAQTTPLLPGRCGSAAGRDAAGSARDQAVRMSVATMPAASAARTT